MTILTDVNADTGLNDNSAFEALMKSFAAPKGSKAVVDTDPDDEDEDLEDDLDDTEDDEEDEDADEDDDGAEDDDESDEDEEEGEGDEKPADEPKPTVAPADDAVVKVTVDGVETEVTVGSLKRLAGQEASLTKKSQEADVVGGRAALMIQGALAGVMEDLEPYNGVDWMLLQTTMEPDEFAWHRENFTRNRARFDKLVESATQLETEVTTRQAASIAENLTAAKAELAKDVPGWDEALFTKVKAFAIAEGLDADDVAKIANAKVLKLLHKAMLHDEGKAAVAEKVKMAPKRVRKGASAEPVADAGKKAHAAIEKRVLSGRGSEADAMAVLMGRWK